MEFAWTAPDGETFTCLEWLPPENAVGLLICVHGMGGAAADFIPVGEAASRAGYAVYAPNLRGQGLDRPPRRGAWLDLPHLCADLSAFAEMVSERHANAPLFFCGESMGSLVVGWMLAHRAIALPVRGAILSVPVVELTHPTPWPIRQALRFLAYALPYSRFSPSWFVNGKSGPLKVTRDEAHLTHIRQAPHHIPVFSFRFLHHMGLLIESSSATAAHLETPCLVMAAGRDVFIRAEQIRRWYDQVASSDKTYREYPEAFHLLWNDWDRDQVLRDMLAWLNARR